MLLICTLAEDWGEGLDSWVLEGGVNWRPGFSKVGDSTLKRLDWNTNSHCEPFLPPDHDTRRMDLSSGPAYLHPYRLPL